MWGDSIRGRLDNGGNLPRIPPVRLGSQLRFQTSDWDAEIGISHYFDQERVAALETRTDGYTLVDAEVTYTFATDDNDFTIFLKGNNLTNEDARVHSSFLKNQAPLPGRGFSIGVRGMF